MPEFGTFIIVLCVLLILSGLAIVLSGSKRKPTVGARTAPDGRVRLTPEQTKEAVRLIAEGKIRRLKSAIAELRALFEDQSKVDLSNIEQHLATAEQQFAAGEHEKAIRTCFGPLIAVEDSVHNIKINHRQGKIESFAISVSNPGDDNSK